MQHLVELRGSSAEPVAHLLDLREETHIERFESRAVGQERTADFAQLDAVLFLLVPPLLLIGVVVVSSRGRSAGEQSHRARCRAQRRQVSNFTAAAWLVCPYYPR